MTEIEELTRVFINLVAAKEPVIIPKKVLIYFFRRTVMNMTTCGCSYNCLCLNEDLEPDTFSVDLADEPLEIIDLTVEPDLPVYTP